MVKKGLVTEMLNAGSDKLAKSRAERLLKTATRTSRDYVESLDKKLDTLNSKRDEIMEISAGIDLNKGMHGISDEQMVEKINNYHKITKEITLLELELQIAKKTDKLLIVGEEEEKK